MRGGRVAVEGVALLAVLAGCTDAGRSNPRPDTGCEQREYGKVTYAANYEYGPDGKPTDRAEQQQAVAGAVGVVVAASAAERARFDVTGLAPATGVDAVSQEATEDGVNAVVAAGTGKVSSDQLQVSSGTVAGPEGLPQPPAATELPPSGRLVQIAVRQDVCVL